MLIRLKTSLTRLRRLLAGTGTVASSFLSRLVAVNILNGVSLPEPTELRSPFIEHHSRPGARRKELGMGTRAQSPALWDHVVRETDHAM